MRRLSSYFSFQGRSNRQRYWVTGITIFMLYFLAALIVGALAELPMLAILGGLLFLVLIRVSLVAGLANGARRLHDRGKSAWWLLLFVGLPTLLSIPSELVKYSHDADAQALGLILLLPALPFYIWGFVVMACLKGATGPNRYGEDPLAPPVEEAFA
jgi:uncharacterized membrane protein YhaH (DUF805 family)